MISIISVGFRKKATSGSPSSHHERIGRSSRRRPVLTSAARRSAPSGLLPIRLCAGPQDAPTNPGQRRKIGRRRTNFVSARKSSCRAGESAYLRLCPISHVPVVVCRSAGIRTRGRSTVGIKPAAGGETGEPRLSEGSRLKATTDRAFSSLSTLQRSAYRRGLSFLPGVRKGKNPLPSDGYSNRIRCPSGHSRPCFV